MENFRRSHFFRVTEQVASGIRKSDSRVRRGPGMSGRLPSMRNLNTPFAMALRACRSGWFCVVSCADRKIWWVSAKSRA
ncbi:hypothetical protein Ga0080559_TMP4923 [Salipiger profundus]|uniref:Uncharacterized protein n=1 Tax=Salipiger profundus TaxID=1229727 RepID=A0A1U7DC54_9RHOB|nr:hypothetical protein Ga0080559_TMP4923 [Salipiger profundus]